MPFVTTRRSPFSAGRPLAGLHDFTDRSSAASSWNPWTEAGQERTSMPPERWMLRFGPTTRLLILTLLFAGLASGTAELMDRRLVNCPICVGVATMETTMLMPLERTPRLKLSTPPKRDAGAGLAETKLAPAGNRCTNRSP